MSNQNTQGNPQPASIMTMVLPNGTVNTEVYFPIPQFSFQEFEAIDEFLHENLPTYGDATLRRIARRICEYREQIYMGKEWFDEKPVTISLWDVEDDG